MKNYIFLFLVAIISASCVINIDNFEKPDSFRTSVYMSEYESSDWLKEGEENYKVVVDQLVACNVDVLHLIGYLDDDLDGNLIYPWSSDKVRDTGDGESEDGGGTNIFRATEAMFDEAIAYAHSQGLNVGIAIDVLSWMNGGFSAVSWSDSTKRENYVNQLVAFVDEHNLQEINYDWEFPVTPEEGEGYRLMIEGVQKGITILNENISDVNMKIKSGIATITGIDGSTPKSVYDTVDYIYIMGYMHQPGGNYKSFTEGNLYTWAVLRGYGPNKLITGIPFYENNGFTESNTISYKNIVDYDQDPNTEGHQYIGKDAEFGKGIGKHGLEYEFRIYGVDIVQEIIDITYNSYCGGVTIWSFSQDIPLGHAKYDELSLMKGMGEKLEELKELGR